MEARAPHILLVEDNPNDVELTLHCLRRNHVANPVVVARDGAEALDLLFGEESYANGGAPAPPLMVLLDLRLPLVDGLEVLRRVRTHERTKDLPVVVLTSSPDPGEIVRCIDLGVDKYIAKPVDFQQLSEVVRQTTITWVLVEGRPAG